MLPGGMDVQGLFFVTNEDVFQKNESKVVSCLKKLKESMNMEEPVLWPVFHIKKKSTQVKVISLADPHKSKMSNYEESDLQWLCLKANLILDQPLAFTEEKTNCPLKEKLDVAVKKMEFALDNAVMLIGGKFRKKSDQICSPPTVSNPTKSGKKSGKKEQFKDDSTTTEASCDEYDGSPGSKSVKEFDVDILFGDSCSSLEDCVISDVNSRMQITGRMCARAFVHRYATVDQAIKALKIDIMRTFQARLEMHCETLVGDEIQGDTLPILHEPPRRVNIKLPYTPITVSDFLFPGETQEESVKAVEEMLGFTPNFEHLDDELEIVASPQHIRMEDDSESRTESPVLETTKAQNSFSSFQIILSILVVLAALGASYLLTMSPDSEAEVTAFETEDGHSNVNPTM